ncbi:MAG: septum site-determining protein MinC [Anaerolineae bacterium]
MSFAIKGNKDGLLITINPTEEWQLVLNELASRIDEQGAFFSGARITVEVGERPVPKHELTSLKALLERRGLTLWSVHSDSDTTLNAAQALDLHIAASSAVAARVDGGEGAPIDPEEGGTTGIMIRHTLRSGRTVHSAGHVVIFGDVNPGAEIVAAGDVIIWGRLRGNVHAGAEGDENAVVCALDMTPTQLRIARYIVTSPEDKRRKPKPEMALIRDHQIVVEAWQ